MAKPFKKAKEPSSTLEILLVGGIRPVKGQLRALKLIKSLRKNGLNIRLTLIGPIIDAKYAEEVFSSLDSHNGDRYLQPVSHFAMQEIYTSADVLINCSNCEGASNAILEAWSYGMAVAARKAPGNTELVQSAPEEIALLFSDSSDVDLLHSWLANILLL